MESWHTLWPVSPSPGVPWPLLSLTVTHTFFPRSSHSLFQPFSSFPVFLFLTPSSEFIQDVCSFSEYLHPQKVYPFSGQDTASSLSDFLLPEFFLDLLNPQSLLSLLWPDSHPLPQWNYIWRFLRHLLITEILSASGCRFLSFLLEALKNPNSPLS